MVLHDQQATHRHGKAPNMDVNAAVEHFAEFLRLNDDHTMMVTRCADGGSQGPASEVRVLLIAQSTR